MKAAAAFVLCLLAVASAEQFTINKYMRPTGFDRFMNLFEAMKFSKIVGGEEAVPHSHPYQVGLLLTMEGGTAFCGGSLISSTVVMTAAHCVNDGRNQVSLFTVVLGAHNIYDEPNSLRIQTTEAIVHERWSALTLQNDIALLILPVAVDFSDKIGVISMPPRSLEEDDFVDELATVSGWGKDADSSNSISSVLREVEIEIIGNSQCNTWYFGVIQPTHICASGRGGKSSCNGDSGGPLTVVADGKTIQVGVVSFGIALGCEVGWPSAYTRTTKYLDWISENAGIQIE